MLSAKKAAILLSALILICSVAFIVISLYGGSPEPEAGKTESAGGSSSQISEPPASEGPDAPSFPSPAPTVTPEPNESPALSAGDAVRQMVAEMSLREKICQLFVVLPGEVPSLEEYPVGGLVYLAEHLPGGEAVISGIQDIQSRSAIPLLICADEEGGSVNRLMSQLGTTYIGPMFNYRDYGLPTAYENAATIAEDMLYFGFNTDFAPVADVWSNPANTVIGRRAYSDDFGEAAGLVASAVSGFKDKGLICTLKHFPGHGDTAEDTHHTAAFVTKSLDELRREEFLPFAAGIEAGADMVMVGHMTVPEISNRPASIEYEVVTGLLRNELGFEGVIITDALTMDSVTSIYTDGELCVAGVLAGIDLLLAPKSLTDGVAALEAAVINGEISEKRIDRSVERILLMKYENGLLPGLMPAATLS